MRHLFRVSVILVVLGSFFVGPAVAQVSAADTRCFTEAQCKQVRGDSGGEENEGFYDRPDSRAVCGEALDTDGKTVPLGFCLPVGQATTKINFGGKKTFANFGDFIQYGYRYGMWVAGIIAVAFIVISGVQWAASGGNSDMISSAKNRISGAITGLILLTLSYTILNTVNPYLVQLRLPQAWMINTIGITPPMCSNVVDKKLAYLGPNQPEITQAQRDAAYATARQTTGYKIDPKTNGIAANADPKDVPKCGYSYLVDGSNTLSCSGSACPLNNVCSPLHVSGGTKINANKCVAGQMAFHIFISQGLLTQVKQIMTNEAGWFKWWLAKLNTDADWIQKDMIWVVPVCQKSGGEIYAQPDKLESKNNNIGFDTITLDSKKKKLVAEEYLLHVGSLDTESTVACEPPEGEDKSKEGFAAKRVGYVLKVELDQEADTTDAELYFGFSPETNSLVFGPASQVYNAGAYFSYEQIENGFYGEIPLDNATISAMIDESD